MICPKAENWLEVEKPDFLLVFSTEWCVLKKKKNEEKRKKKGLMVDLGDPVIRLELFRASIIEDALKITFFQMVDEEKLFVNM